MKKQMTKIAAMAVCVIAAHTASAIQINEPGADGVPPAGDQQPQGEANFERFKQEDEARTARAMAEIPEEILDAIQDTVAGRLIEAHRQTNFHIVTLFKGRRILFVYNEHGTLHTYKEEPPVGAGDGHEFGGEGEQEGFDLGDRIPMTERELPADVLDALDKLKAVNEAIKGELAISRSVTYSALSDDGGKGGDYLFDHEGKLIEAVMDEDAEDEPDFPDAEEGELEDDRGDQ